MTEPDLRCERARTLLSLRTDAAATPDQERELAEHLAACDGCRAAAAVDRAVSTRLAGRARDDVPAGFAERVLESALAQRAAALAQNRFLRRCAAAAVLAAVATTAWSRIAARDGPDPSGPGGVASARAAAEGAVFRTRMEGR